MTERRRFRILDGLGLRPTVTDVVRDRLDTVEKLAAAKGVMLDAEIEAFEPDQATLEARELRRQDFLARLFYLARKQAAEVASDDNEERYTEALDDIAVN